MSNTAWHRSFRLITCAFVAVHAALLTGHAVAASEAKTTANASPVPALSAEEWRARTEIDLAAFADALRQNYIYAVHPDPAGWRVGFDRTLATVQAGLPHVQDEAGYQAVLRHLAATLQDSHVGVTFKQTAPAAPNWPGFLARFDNGAYRITASRQRGINDGADVSACDGKPLSWWVSRSAQYEIGLPDSLEVTRNEAALRLFIDRGSPLRPRPSECTIDGRPVTLTWTTAPMQELRPIMSAWLGWGTPEASTRLVGTEGAWVKLGYFAPTNAQQAKDFYAAIEAAPSLRHKRFIVIDVRGNGGGPYNWFMAYLRGLYGQAYADHYATERLHIRGVYRLSPAYIKLNQEMKAEASEFKEPPDPPYEMHEVANETIERDAIAAGEPFYRATPIRLPVSDIAPENPVRAQVYVLTNYACASACIAFVDEMKRFPGVRQIGLPTFVDSRSGTAVGVELPSKQATVWVAAMTRDGRIRDDNASQLPSLRFTGDIRDDAAVERWFLQQVLTEP